MYNYDRIVNKLKGLSPIQYGISPNIIKKSNVWGSY
ncbi:IS3 family transposase [Mycoplasmopsis fermentans]